MLLLVVYIPGRIWACYSVRYTAAVPTRSSFEHDGSRHRYIAKIESNTQEKSKNFMIIRHPTVRGEGRLRHLIFFFFFLYPLADGSKIKLKLPHFHVSDSRVPI